MAERKKSERLDGESKMRDLLFFFSCNAGVYGQNVFYRCHAIDKLLSFEY